jgi:hypothetical protein
VQCHGKESPVFLCGQLLVATGQKSPGSRVMLA